jgi:hypothetical protein
VVGDTVVFGLVENVSPGVGENVGLRVDGTVSSKLVEYIGPEAGCSVGS